MMQEADYHSCHCSIKRLVTTCVNAVVTLLLLLLMIVLRDCSLSVSTQLAAHTHDCSQIFRHASPSTAAREQQRRNTHCSVRTRGCGACTSFAGHAALLSYNT